MSTSYLNAEITGDWNNLKGTDYHLVYALWLLLRCRVPMVAFYEGNDLLLRHTTPPTQHEDSQPPISMGVQAEEEDLWIQLKATDSPWTRTKLLEGNLLKNFIFNALKSRSEDRKWRIQLVTQGVVRKPDILEFVARPLKKPQLNATMEKIIDEVFERCREIETFSAIAREKIRELALTILEQLAETVPLPLSTIKAEIELELALAYPSRGAVEHLGNALLGALLQRAAKGPNNYGELNLDWLNASAGKPIVERGLLETDPQAAVSATVTSAVRDWQPEQSIGRQLLEDALERFMESDRTAFVLVGVSGVGKSWALARWASTRLVDQVHVFVPGTDLVHRNTLSSLVADRLRHYTNADWQDEVFLRYLNARAIEKDLAFPVVIIDDLFVPRDSADVFRRKLSNIVDQARQHNAKLVLSCQKHIWQYNRLTEEISHQELYWEQPGGGAVSHEPLNLESLPNHREEGQAETKETVPKLGVGHSPERMTYSGFSFELSDFSIPEIKQFLRKKYSDDPVKTAVGWLQSPSLLLLRRPYFLDLFLKEHGEELATSKWRGSPIVVSDLMDRWVAKCLDWVARAVGCSLADSQTGLQVLAKAIWDERPVGLTYAASMGILEAYFPEQAHIALSEMRQAGLIASEGNIRFAEPPIAEHYFGQQLRSWFENDEELIAVLRPEEDSGVVTAMLRAPTSGIDPIWLSESVVAEDERWVDAAAHGLAQYPKHDYRVLAILSSLARPPSDLIVHLEATKALGEIAARERQHCSQALKWVARMYLARSKDAYRGAQALSTVINYSPKRVEAIFRLKLRQLQTIDRHRRQEKWNEILGIALTPYLGIANDAAAAGGIRALDRIHALAAKEGFHLDASMISKVEEVRGLIALFNDEQKAHILEQLASTDPEVRFSAACALRTMVFAQPSSAEDAILEAIAQERNGRVLNRLLWAGYPLITRVATQLLTALEKGEKLNWDESSIAAGMLLTVLGDLAEHAPEHVNSHLPETLDAYSKDTRALLSEVHAYSLWRSAEYNPSAKDVLQAHARPNLTDLPNEFHIFAIRGALIAQLGLMCLGTISSNEFVGRQSAYMGSELRFLYLLEGGDFARNHAGPLLRHADYNVLEELMISCVGEESKINVDPRNRFLRNARFRCASLSLDMLAALAIEMPDSPARLVEALPLGWQSLSLSRRILKEGRTEEDVLTNTKRICAQFANAAAGQEHLERALCLAQLAAHEDDPERALANFRSLVNSPISGNDITQGLASLTDANTDRILALLNQSVTSAADLPLLFYWQETAESWRGLLLASVFSRMFDAREIAIPEAISLCEQVLAVVESLPDSEHQYEYAVTYKSILDWLRGEGRSETPTLPSDPQSLLQTSHFRALALLTMAREWLLKKHPAGSWINQSLQERTGWLESSQYQIKDGIMNWGAGAGVYTIYVLPAVRLALVALGEQFSAPDPAGNFMRGRYEVNKLLKKHTSLLDPRRVDLGRDRAHLKTAVSDMEEYIERLQDERLYAALGLLLLLLGDLQSAESVLLSCLRIELCQGQERADVLYNLACVSARQGREADCRSYLVEADSLKRFDRELMMKDPDLEAVRDMEWFEVLLES